MSDTVMRWMAAAAFIVALGTPADAADLSPPSPPRHRPHRLLPRAPSHHVPVVPPAGDLPRTQTGQHAENPILDWGANSTFDGPPARFPTNASGVIGGTMPSSNCDLSPNWLTGIESRGSSAPYLEFHRYDAPIALACDRTRAAFCTRCSPQTDRTYLSSIRRSASRASSRRYWAQAGGPIGCCRETVRDVG
jgi:hypothetical protein